MQIPTYIHRAVDGTVTTLFPLANHPISGISNLRVGAAIRTPRETATLPKHNIEHATR